MDTEEKTTDNDTPNPERKPPKQRASEAGVDVPESAHVGTSSEQLKNDTERITWQSHEGSIAASMRQETKHDLRR